LKRRQAQPGTVLYTFKSKDSLRKGYLFGTMHINNAPAFSFYDLGIEALKRCDLLATEIDLDIGSSYDLNAMLTMGPGQQLKQFYTAKQYAKMRRQLIKSFDVDIELLKSFVPLFIANYISEKEMMKTKQKPLDLAIWQQAIELDIDRTGLENFEAHYQVLKRIPLEYQAYQLLKLSKNISRFRSGMNSITNHYERGDLQMLYRITKKSLGKMRKIMLYDRNHIITESVHKFAADHKLFAAMGASHLWGKTGVIALLKNIGYELKPVYRFEDQ